MHPGSCPSLCPPWKMLSSCVFLDFRLSETEHEISPRISLRATGDDHLVPVTQLAKRKRFCARRSFHGGNAYQNKSTSWYVVHSYGLCVIDSSPISPFQETSFTNDDFSFGKALPRLPSTCDDLDDEETTEPTQIQPSSTSVSPSHNGLPDQKAKEILTKAGTREESVQRKETDPARLLSNLRHTFQGTERILYAQLARTQVSSLNDVRWSFRSTARVAAKRLSAWENKHLPSKAKSQINSEKVSITQPDWWERGCHAVPGGNVIVREGDWGSIIAYTLRYFAYSSVHCLPLTRTSFQL